MRMAERLRAARWRQFVGRTAELAMFAQVIASPEPPFVVLHIHGPGGVGKSTLLKAFAQQSEQNGVRTLALDGREIEPTPEAFLGALRHAMALDVGATPLDALLAYAGRQVLLIDTYEQLGPIDGWLRDVFMPQAPAGLLVVLAGREGPTLGWRTDLGWQGLLRSLPLRNLSPDEARAYLGIRDVPPEHQQPVLNFTHGHPLALSLVADLFAQRSLTRFEPEQSPDMIRSLLAHLVQRVPGPAHRVALEVCALVRLTSEALLAHTLELPDAHELFDWLRGLSFVETTPRGIFPHDLAREALALDLRWRNPEWYAELHRRARAYYTARLGQSHGAEQQRLLMDLIYLHRDNPVVRPFYEWQMSGTSLPEPAHPEEHEAILALIERHEGPMSAAIAARWIAEQPAGVLVLRDPEHPEPAGLLIQLMLHAADPQTIAADPATHAAWEHLQRTAPLRSGEAVVMFRFWMARETYQAVSAVQSTLFVAIVRHYLITPALAYTCFVCANPDFWAPGLAYADLYRLPGGDFQSGQYSFGIFGHDWRVTPPAAWLALLAERETASGIQAVTPPPAQAALVVLSADEFATAVRQALQEYVRPDALRSSPLLRSRLVAERTSPTATPAERVAALQSAIREAATALQASPRDLKAYRALHHTYLQPATTQEQAAELLDLPFSTYRRHLKSGVGQLIELLWLQETEGG